jgi:hypothetical protein
MNELNAKSAAERKDSANDFSLVLGGPLFQLMRRARLADDDMRLLLRRLIILPLLAWLPLLILSALEGKFQSGTALPFLLDIEVHIRFLIAMPLLILAELYVHDRLRLILSSFLRRDLVPEQDMEKFRAAVASALKMRNSISAEICLIILVYLVGILIVWKHFIGLEGEAWYATFQNGTRTLNFAGYWFVLFSLPFFQFLLIRWYYRLFIWIRFLWQVSRIQLRLVASHPDRFGGLGFVTHSVYAFTFLAAAHGALLSALISNRIFFSGASLTDFKIEIAIMLGFVLMLFVAPLFLFSNQLSAAKRIGRLEYGDLAHKYVRQYDSKWLRGGASADEPFIGSADIQSLADLGNGYEVVDTMRFIPIGKDSLLQLIGWTLLPLLPLVFTLMPLDELLRKLVNILL